MTKNSKKDKRFLKKICKNSIRHFVSYLRIGLRALDFYAVIVDEGESTINA